MTVTTTAARAMGTATSRALAALLPLAAAGCGGSGASGSPATSPGRVAAASPPAAGPLSLTARAAPASWRSQRIPSGAVLFFPPGWQLVHGDAGTATAETVNPRGAVIGYLNITPRQSKETLTNWAHFRLAHNVGEGDRSLRREAVATGVRFRTGRGSCVRDSYTTSTGARYLELACLVKGMKSSVIIAAAPPADWKRIGPLLEQSVSALLT
jgi:hypothetical protein